MRLYSTKDPNELITLREAVLQGMPLDNGLYMPLEFPRLPLQFFLDLSGMTLPEISFEIGKSLLGDDVPETEIRRMVESAINFDAPLVKIAEKTYVLELFHGPTLAFKDFGARFMSHLMAYFIKDSDRKLNILVATSGDTGSAVANGFFRIPGINVVVLYPSGKVSRIQEKQIATLGENIIAIEVTGTFDDCQQIVKQALIDKDVNHKRMLTSANSINISRLIPQTFYYFYGYAQLPNPEKKKVVFSVPSGNLGNLTAGLMAKRMGLPIYKFIAATNVNDVVPCYLERGVFKSKTSVQTISNAMDVGNPSNFARIQNLYDYSWPRLCGDLMGASFNDQQTREAIREVYEKHKYILDPHGAVGYLGLKFLFEELGDVDQGIFLETAHPAKFPEVVEAEINTSIPIPESLRKSLNKKVSSIKMENQFSVLKEFLLSDSRFN